MPCQSTARPHFRKSLLALAASAALAPYAAWSLELADAPPGTIEPYVRPNVIVTFDDSGSMKYKVNATNDTSDGVARDAPVNGSWPGDTQRISVLKATVKEVFESDILPDGKIRLAWQTMHNNGNKSSGKCAFPGADDVNSTGKHNMKVLSSSHRQNFLDFISCMVPNSGTPTHAMAYQAHKYMTTGNLSKDSPWALDPGTTGSPYLGCRRNYHILMSDGGWQTAPTSSEKPGNADGQNFTLPDGTTYNKVKPYADDRTDMVADWAFKSWSTKLRTDLTGAPRTDSLYRKAIDENFGNDTKEKPAILTPYWNPRYNPATWPHMVTYTIGFSKAATTWSGEPNIKRPPDTDIVPFSYDKGKNGSLPDFITGNIAWPNLTTSTEKTKNPLDLWHAALNGRGRYYAVENGDDLKKAFLDIFKQISVDVAPNTTSTATSGANLTQIGGENYVYQFTGKYEPQNYWKGFILGERLTRDGSNDTDPTKQAMWGGQNTAQKIDAMTPATGDPTSRKILSWSDKRSNTGKEQGGVLFKWASDETNLSTWQKSTLGLNPGATGGSVANNGENRLKFIRGDRSKEGSESTGYTEAKPYRERKSRQGDIVNSVVWFAAAPASNYTINGYSAFAKAQRSRTPMIYVGGNDGMLHGFSADDGEEKLAYIPKGVIPSLYRLTAQDYNSDGHKYFVDGSPMTGDVDMGSNPNAPENSPATSNWRTLLVGTLGAGGKGYFVLDVTAPSSFADIDNNTKVQQVVKIDRTRSTEPSSAPNCNATSLSTTEKAACNAALEEDKDIGHITAQPVLDDNNPIRTTQIARLNNNRWAAVLGNGYNSQNQRPVLLIQYLDGDMALKRIQTTSDATGTGRATDNGLSAPRLVDINGDDRPDIAYAGDNLGNLWKFDLTSENEDNWGIAFSGKPFFTAKGGTSGSKDSRVLYQPISAPPTARPNDRKVTIKDANGKDHEVEVGGMMVTFGTGRNVGGGANDDASNDNIQTLYSVLDNTRYKIISTEKGKRLAVHPGGGTCTPVPKPDCAPIPKAFSDLSPNPSSEGPSSANLVKRTATATGATVDDSDAIDWNNPTKTTGNYGWYMDFPVTGERLLKPISLYDGSNILNVYSQVPARGSNKNSTGESCEASPVGEELQYRTFINMMDGAKPSVQLTDIYPDGLFNQKDGEGTRKKVAKGPHIILVTGRDSMMDKSSICQDPNDAESCKEGLARMPEESMRPSWRQLK